MTPSELIPVLLFLPKLVAGGLLPGYLLGKLIRSPAAWLSAYLGSALVLFYLVLGFDAAHILIDGGTLALGLVVVNAGLLLAWWRFRSTAGSAAAQDYSIPEKTSRWWLWILPPVIALSAIAVRAICEPLSGWDTVFRWDFLARQLLRTGTLSFYPPVTADDFLNYGWCDGIPPLTSVLHFWSYLCAGQAAMVATAPHVIFEAGLLFYAVGRLARNLWGPAAAWPAIAALATSSLVLWGVAMGQETGLTALTLAGLFVFLNEYQQRGAAANLFWAGVAAGLGGLSREYGLAWIFLGLGTLAWTGKLRPGWKIFLSTAILVSAPWYLRNWLHTGNPLYPQTLGGIFPGNPVHEEFMGIISGRFSIGGHASKITFALQFLAVLTGPVFILGLWGFLRAPRAAFPLLASALAVVALWLWSIGQTGGGWVYASRVLTPAISLAAVLAGGVVPGLRSSRAQLVLALVLLAFAVDACPRMLSLPRFSLEPAWRLKPGTWFGDGRLLAQARSDPVWKNLVAAARGRAILVDQPSLHAMFCEAGGIPVPLVSPQVSFVFDERLPFQEILTRLKAAQIRFLVLDDHEASTDPLMVHHAFLRKISSGAPIVQNGLFRLYDLYALPP